MDFSLQMWSDIPKVLQHHWKEGNYNTFMCFYIPIVHMLGVYGFIYHAAATSAQTWIWCYFIYYMTGMLHSCCKQS
jgi:hypothetical protein